MLSGINNINGLSVLLAFIPILWLLICLLVLKISSYWAGFSAFAIAVVISIFAFKMPVIHMAEATIEGTMVALFPILWVVFSALFVYRVTVESGGMNTIKLTLSGISEDRRVQALLMAFAFGGFLEAVAGFGTSVAIPAGILIALGFRPVLAATICLIANTIPVAFGVLGVPIVTLAQVTMLPLNKVSLYTALQLIPFVVLLPCVLIYSVTGTIKGLRGVTLPALISGLVFAACQTLTTIYIGPELAAVFGAIGTLLFLILWFKMFPVKKPWRFPNESQIIEKNHQKVSIYAGIRAWIPYILILLLVFSIRFLPILDFLNKYPFNIQKQFYFGTGGKPISFNIGTSAGTILLIAALLGGLLQGLTIGKLFRVLLTTLKHLWKTCITVISIVAMSKVMGYSGMISSIASFFALSGKVFPLISPAIGALGTFLTGSDTSSNVLFGNLQKQTAQNLGMDQVWLVAANATGATAGKMISPQSISIATTAVGIEGEDSNIMRNTLRYCVIYVLLMGLMVYIFR